MKRIAQDISHWLWFTLVLSMVPLLVSLWRSYSNPVEHDFWSNVARIISHGEVLLLCCSILAKSLGELIKKSQRMMLVRTWIAGAIITILLFTALAFSEVSLATVNDADYIMHTSKWVFVGTTLLALSSIVLPETAQNKEVS